MSDLLWKRPEGSPDQPSAAQTLQSVGLPDLLGRLLKAVLGRVNLATAAVDVMLHVAHVVKAETSGRQSS
jgi:hypothetical protein